METHALAYAAVSRSALLGNYRRFRRMIPADVRLLTLMKADAYGHGAVWAARLLEAEGCDFFGVATAGEALELREAGIRTPILVLGYTPASDIPALARAHVSQCVPDLDAAREYNAALASASLAAAGSELTLAVHAALDTGMARYGLDARDPDAAVRALTRIAALPQLALEGVFTHFADADNPADAYTAVQEPRFETVVRRARALGVRIPIAHCENSAAMIKYDGFRFDMTRLGISLYGIAPSDPTPLPDGIKPVMSLHTTVVQVHELSAGESVSYGRRFVTSHPSRIAVLRIGYGDGLPRALTNRGRMLVRGQYAPMVGTVCMDACMLDVTDIPGVQRGDDVIVFGSDGQNTITAADTALACHTIPYELVTCLMPRVPRVVVD